MKPIFYLSVLLMCTHLSAQSCFAPVEVFVSDVKNVPYVKDKIVFVGTKTHKVVVGLSNEKGIFNVNLPCGDIYEIKVSSVGEEMEYNTVEIPTLGPGEEFDAMKLHIFYELPTAFTLNDLHFETAQAVIQPSSFASLNLVADYLKRKSTMQVEIGGHTDDAGEDSANLKLSKERANAVKLYLISKGVSEKQIIAIGYGETRPVASNSTAVGRQQNRRTEIHILAK
jgi:OOP family OmpA-OmpF porin